MADKELKFKENVRGPFYVDQTCIDCDLCRQAAPNNFAVRNEQLGYYVKKQPSSPQEVAQCKKALEACPVEAIGNDGE